MAKDKTEQATEEYFEGDSDQNEMFDSDDYQPVPAAKRNWEVSIILKLKPTIKGGQAYALPVLPFPIRCPGEEVRNLLTKAIGSETFTDALEGVAGGQVGTDE